MFNAFSPALMSASAAVVAVYYNSIRSRHRITRSAILLPEASPWRNLLENGDDQSFLNLTGFSREAFNALHEVLFDENEYEVEHVGRPRLMNTRDELGLLLFYCGSCMQLKNLCLLFGCSQTRCSAIIRSMLRRCYNRLKNEPRARIHWPRSIEEKNYYASLIRNREPSVTDVIGFTDGVSLPIRCASDPISQATNYNGYHHDTMCNNVFCFAPTGKIIYGCINFPGSWHDSQVCQHLIAKVVHSLGNYKICVDQGFPRTGDLLNKFVGPISVRQRRALPIERRHEVIRRHNIYVSLRQSSEWGMRALQGTFTRLKSRLPAEKEKRKLIISTICYLHNFRTHIVGLNQIATVFNPEYQAIIHMNNYDRIARYYENEVESSDDDE
jgi:hypothetical protein